MLVVPSAAEERGAHVGVEAVDAPLAEAEAGRWRAEGLAVVAELGAPAAPAAHEVGEACEQSDSF